MRTNCYFDGSHLCVTKEAWDELKKDQSGLDFRTMADAARDLIKRHGAFIVYSDKGVMCRCDRLSDLEKEINAAIS